MHADAGGIQGTGGDFSVDDPWAHPVNDEYVRPAAPELPAQNLNRYRQTVLELLHAGETVPAALRCVQTHHFWCLLSFVCLFDCSFVCSFVCLFVGSVARLLMHPLTNSYTD